MQVTGCYAGSGVCKAISDKVMAIRDGRKGGVNHVISRQRPPSSEVLYRGSPGLFKVRKAGVAGLQTGEFRGDRGRRCKPLLTTGGPRWADMAGHDGQPLLLL